MKYQVVKGTRDILPGESSRWQRVEAVIRRVMSVYNCDEIRTPVFEQTALFTRSIGEGTDIVNKEMYTFEDKGGRSLTLKPEGTASVVRAYLQHGLGNVSRLTKLYYLFPLFRQEKPQEGRYRQHHQFGLEAFGSEDPALDYEVIQLLLDIYAGCGLKDFRLHINTIGCRDCRPRYIGVFRDFLADRRDALCEDCRKRYEVNPLRIFDCKIPSCQDVVSGAPAITDNVCEACSSHFGSVAAYLKNAGIEAFTDKRLVRGFDYYTRTAFEVKCASLGAQDAVGGGGRYNNLVRELGGADVPAVGFGSGIERLLLALEKQGGEPPLADSCAVYCAVLDEQAAAAALQIVRTIRQHDVRVEMNFGKRSLKAQMREANRLGAAVVLMLGESEIQDRTVTVKDMETGTQETHPQDRLLHVLGKYIAPSGS